MENSIIESNWLFLHHPIPKAKFQPITALLNRAKGSPTPCPQTSQQKEIAQNLLKHISVDFLRPITGLQKKIVGVMSRLRI